MFTSSIKSKSFFNGEFKVEVEFTDGTQKWNEGFTILNLDDLNNKVRHRLKVLIQLEALALSLPTGIYTPTEPTGQTQEQIDSDKWFRQLQKLRGFQELKAMGAMPVAWQADLDALVAKVQTDARKAYLTDM